jgi:acyl carrier protein
MAKFDLSKFSPSSPMADYGVDSLDSVIYVITMELDFKTELTDEEALSITTVDSAYAVFSKYKEITK